MIIPAVITVYHDKSFSFITKTPPASILIFKKLGLSKGSSNPKKERVAQITREQLKEIAEIKMPDLNAYDIEAAIKIVEGSAKSAGVTVVD